MSDPIKLAVMAGGVALVVATGLSSTGQGSSPVSKMMQDWRGASPQVPVQQASAGVLLPPQANGGSGLFQQIRIPREPDGHYHLNAEVEGRLVPMLVDTGATVIALRYEDAEQVGIYPAPADFNIPMNTANGTGYAAPVMLREVRVGQIALHDVQAVVVPRGALTGSLLGMSFLNKLASFQVAADNLILTP